jgi:glucosamine-6-phosphate isomerase
MNLLRFDSEEAWINALATFWRDRLRLKPSLRLCLPSGHTPNPIFAAMARSAAKGDVSFRLAEIFALDEFGDLAPDDEGRCVNMLRRYLLDHIDLPKNKFHFIDVDSPDVEKVCRDYEKEIDEGFDLTLLGIGLNGHLGLNEPGSAVDSTVRRVEMHPTTISVSAKYLTHQKLPTWGITVGMKQLLASKEVWLLANGTKKAEIIERTIKGDIGPSLPASLLRMHPNSFLFVEAAAAALI